MGIDAYTYQNTINCNIYIISYCFIHVRNKYGLHISHMKSLADVTRSSVPICNLHFILTYITEQMWQRHCKYRQHCPHFVLVYRSETGAHMCQKSKCQLLHDFAYIPETNMPANCTYMPHIWWAYMYIHVQHMKLLGSSIWPRTLYINNINGMTMMTTFACIDCIWPSTQKNSAFCYRTKHFNQFLSHFFQDHHKHSYTHIPMCFFSSFKTIYKMVCCTSP